MINRNLLALYAITFLVILPLACFNMENSLYFLSYSKDGVKQRQLEENSRRLEEAHRYFETLDLTKLDALLQSLANDQNPGALKIAITIITVSRNLYRRSEFDKFQPMYLTQVTWKFLTKLYSIKAEGFLHRITLSICNVDNDPNTYEEAKSISHVVPVFQRFNKTHVSQVHVLEKEKDDYVFCLNRSLENNPDYVLLVEDDALPTSDFFSVLDRTLKLHLVQRIARGEFIAQFENIAFIKFFHPERLLSFWNFDRERIPELIAITILLGISLKSVYNFIAKGKESSVALCLFIYSFLVIAIVGRPNFTNFRSIFSPYLHTFTPAPSCCTQAMLFPFTSAAEVISYLHKVTCHDKFGKDSGLDRMISETKLKAYLVQPNTFTHVGIYSTHDEKLFNPVING